LQIKEKKLSEDAYNKMMDRDCPYEYFVYYNDILVYTCLGHTKLYKYCKDNFNISRTIIEQLLKNSWEPKFQKHMHLKSLKIRREKRTHNSVSTNPDECKDVE
jgi:hypothetical protein